MHHFRLTLCAIALFFVSTPAWADLLTGDVAIIGSYNDGNPDSFAFVTLTDIAAGTTIYFTDNGWKINGYRGDGSDGNGDESLTAWKSINAIAAGTIISTAVTDASYQWITSGSIPGADKGKFEYLALGKSGEQIYAFQGPNSNPLNAPSMNLYVFDDTNGFEEAIDSSTGAIAPGLSIADHTAVTLNLTSYTFKTFNTNALGSGTKEEWLAAIADVNNWTYGSSGILPLGTINVVVPEPTTFFLLFCSACALLLFRYKK